jgi:NAD-dependent SIR2 family protein deacetylase
MDEFLDNIRRARTAIRESEALLITAGAGMGVDSGLPDFRGAQGFWKAYPALESLGISFVEIANPAAFARDARLAWAFYGHRLNLYRKTKPHLGFTMLLEIGKSKKAGYFVFTSNVDGQFQKAGVPPDRIAECHGSIHHLQCVRPCCDEIWSADITQVVVDEGKFVAQEPLPKCAHCGKLARPNVLMFGDGEWIADRTEAQKDRFEHWIGQVCASKARLVVIEMGAGKSIPTVRSQSEYAARRAKGVLIRINPREAEVPDGHISLPVGALDGISLIAQ